MNKIHKGWASVSVSVSRNEVNAKLTQATVILRALTSFKLSMTLGQACGIIDMASYCPDIPLEDSGIYWHITNMYMRHIGIVLIL